jgi:dTDP-4-amino-4,6-dideoxygalactose transaminase
VRIASNVQLCAAVPAVLGGPPAFAEPVYISRPRLPDQQVFQNRVADIFRSFRLTNNGPLVRELEERLRSKLGVGFCAVFCNGTVALQIALRSLNLSGEVITTPFTFPATAHAIEWNGLAPVFCDVDPDTYNLDVNCAAHLITSRTSAILPVHVFGNPCDVTAIDQLAQHHGLRVVYDAAHAFGVRHRSQPIGCFGDLSMLSFHATKMFHTCEGGALVGPEPGAFRTIALLRNFGIVNEEEVDGVGLNGKMSELHAAVGLGLLDVVDHEIHARGRLVARYRQRLAGIDGLNFQSMATDTVHNHAYFTVEVDEERFGLSRDELHHALWAENIITRKYFWPLCSENASYRHLPSAQPGQLPNARRLASRILCLPVYGDLTVVEVNRIVERIMAIRAQAPKVRDVLRGAA